MIQPQPATQDHSDDANFTAEALRRMVDDRQPLTQVAERLLHEITGND
jgi:hypothetical protein